MVFVEVLYPILQVQRSIQLDTPRTPECFSAWEHAAACGLCQRTPRVNSVTCSTTEQAIQPKGLWSKTIKHAVLQPIFSFFFFWSFRQWRETQRQWIHFMFKGWGALRVMQKSMPQINWLYICMTKQLEEKQLPYPPHMPLKTQPLKRCIMKVDEACSVRNI